jgi:hypothetical protein
MKRTIIVLLTVLLLTASAIYAQKRVRFPSGKTTITLKGRTTGGPSELGGMNPVEYKFYARKGQQLILSLTSVKRNAVFFVYLPNLMDALDKTQNKTKYTGRIPQTGNYSIMIFPADEKTDTNYELKISIK